MLFSVPQGSVLGPYLFIIYTNCIQELIRLWGGEALIYVDDTNIIITGSTYDEIREKALKILKELKKFFASLNLELNWDKTLYMLFENLDEPFDLEIDNVTLKKVCHTTFLGVELQNDLMWNKHVKNLEKSLHKGNFVLSQISATLHSKESFKVYFAFIHSFLSYGCLLWANQLVDDGHYKSIFKLQKRAIRILKYGKLARRQSCRGLFKQFGILTLASIFVMQAALYAKKFYKHNTNDQVHTYNTRNKKDIHITHTHPKAPIHINSRVLNQLPIHIKMETNLKKFKTVLKKWLTNKEFYSLHEFFESNK